MNQYERNFRRDSMASAALLIAGFAWVALAAMQGMPAGTADALVARSPASALQAGASAPTAPHRAAGSNRSATVS